MDEDKVLLGTYMKKVFWLSLEFIIPTLVGVALGVNFLKGLSPSKDTIHWFFGAMIQAFAALLGLIGVIVAFRIQHIREQIRDIQNAILGYSKDSLNWGFAGFDIQEIKKRKDYLFSKRLKEVEKLEDTDDKRENLDALSSEKLRFETMLNNYSALESERQKLYDTTIGPMSIIIGTIVFSIIGLVFSEIISTNGIPFFFGIVALSIWGMFRIGRFLIMMTLRERKIKVFITVDVSVKDKT